MCRRTLLGHKDDVVHLDALGLNKAGPTTGNSTHVLPLSRHSPEPFEGVGTASTGAADGVTPPRPNSRLRRSASQGLFSASVLVASASADGTVRVWNSSWACLRVLTICAPTLAADGWFGPPSPSWQQQQQPAQVQSSASAAAALLAKQQGPPYVGAGASSGCNGSMQGPQLKSAAAAVAGTQQQRNSPAAVVTFADDVPQQHSSSASKAGQQQPHQQQQEGGFAGHLRTSFHAWVPEDQQQQEEGQHAVTQQQPHSQRIEQQPSLEDGIPNQQQHQQPQQHALPPLQTGQQQHSQPQQHHHQQPRQLVTQGSLSKRQQKRIGRQRAHMPATAALVVGISSRHIVGGYSDATIRLWHMDDVYLADLTEQLVTGQIQQSDLALLQEQLIPLGASYNALGSFNPFAGVSFGSHVNISSLGQHASMEFGGSSPPLSPTGLAGQIAGQLVTNAFSTASQLLREGSGTVVGVELMQGSERVRRRGCWCARLRDAQPSRTSSNNLGVLNPAAGGNSSSGGLRGGGGSSGVQMAQPGSSPRGAADAGVDAAVAVAGVSSSALPKTLQCLACGSQDQQLVRALKDFVAIRTVSNNKVRLVCW